MYLKWWTGNLSKPRTMRAAAACLVMVTIIFTSGCALLPKESGDEALPSINPPKISKKPEYVVKTDTLETNVRGSGKIMATKEEELFFTQDNKRLKEIYVKAGDKVTKGQLIAELDVADIENDLRQKQLESRLSELTMKETLRSSDKTSEQMEQAKITFELQRQKLVELEQTVAKAKLVAPYDGTVAAIYVQKGDTIKAYDSVAIIADLSQLTVAVNITPDDLKKVAVGMESTIDLNGAGQLKGKVKQLPNPKLDNNNTGDLNGGGNGNSAKTKDSLANYLLIDLDKIPENIVRGTALGATIVIQRKENVVVIPPSVLRTVSGRNYVQVIDENGTKREVDVEVGQQTSTNVEIKNGLKPGQKVVGR
ncbi:MAG: transporter [Bacilli bacterium]|nr:transporter [Bacilli bacterium]